MFYKIKIQYYRIRYLIRYKEKLDDSCTMNFYGIIKNPGYFIDEEYNFFLDKVSKITKPNAKSVNELIRYLADKYNAEKVQIDHRLYNKFYLKTMQTINDNETEIRTTDDVLKWLYESKHNSNEFFEKINLDLSDEINKSQFKPHFLELKLTSENSNVNMKSPQVYIEETTKTISIVNASKEIGSDIIVYFGVSEQDISLKSKRFIRYAYALRELGIDML